MSGDEEKKGQPPAPKIGGIGARVPFSSFGGGGKPSPERTLSQTREDEQSHSRESVLSRLREGEQSHFRESATKRTKRGYALRDDLIKSLKQIALNEDRKLYEVMEEAMEEYVARKRTHAQS